MGNLIDDDLVDHVARYYHLLSVKKQKKLMEVLFECEEELTFKTSKYWIKKLKETLNAKGEGLQPQ